LVKIASNGGSPDVAAADVAAVIRESLVAHIARWGVAIESCDAEATNGGWPVVVHVTTATGATRSFSFEREPYASNDPAVHATGAMNVVAALLGEEPDPSGGGYRHEPV
jgi:hypothetical protein